MECTHENDGHKTTKPIDDSINDQEIKLLSTTTTTAEAAALPATTTTTEFQRIPTFGKALLLLCGIINFGCSDAVPTAFSVYFLDWQDSFHTSRARTSVIHATCLGALDTGAVLPGLLMSRYGDRVTLLIGCFMAFVGMISSAFATSVTYMVFTTGIFFGLGCCMINLPTIPCITSVFTTHQSIYIASLSFGAGVFNTALPFFNTFLSTQFGWRGSFFILAGLMLNTCVCSLVITSYYSVPKTQEESSQSLLENGHSENSKTSKSTSSSWKISLASLQSFGSQILVPRQNGTVITDSKKSTESISGSKESIQFPDEPTHDSVKKGFVSRLKSSHPFLFDPLYVVVALTSSFSLASMYSTVALLLDFTKTKGYDDKSFSVFLMFLTFLMSMFGKIFTGLINLIPAVHSVHLLLSYSYVSCLILIILDFVSGYYEMCIAFSVLGFVLGGFASGYPKCVLDMKTVETKTYPIALGINNTGVGFFDCVLPVIMAFTVDHYHSYTFALYLFSISIGILTTTLLVTFYFKDRHSCLNGNRTK